MLKPWFGSKDVEAEGSTGRDDSDCSRTFHDNTTVHLRMSVRLQERKPRVIGRIDKRRNDG
eukprot:scaffold4452_cov155-Cylindrotheca_fusiformis.AAC.2